jgi:hypothetical protein
MLDCKPTSTPLPLNALTCPVKEIPASINYWRGVGPLQYLVQCTRPDLAFACSYLAQFINKPSMTHQEQFFSVLHYIQRTKDFGLTLGKTSAIDH